MNKKKEYYYDRNTAPLLYHSFLRYVGLPLAVFINLKRLYIFAQQLDFAGAAGMLDVLFAAALLTMNLLQFIGFFKWKAYAWYATMGVIFTSIAYQLIVLAVTMNYGYDISAAIAQFVSSTVVNILLFIYYKKRKPLFFTEQMERYYATCPRCPGCGHVIEPGMKVCPMCGMPFSDYSYDPSHDNGYNY